MQNLLKNMNQRFYKNAGIWFLGNFFTVYPVLIFLLCSCLSEPLLSQKNPVIVHDPVVIRENGTYYLFCTGPGISMFTSADRNDWTYYGKVFNEIPAWTFAEVDSFRGHIWAPDITFRNGKYYLYYSISSFASNRSCIGVATNTTLDTGNPEYHWADMGIVVQSFPGRDMWNAIDPNLIFDESDVPWMVFGSFWNGIKMVRLDSTLCSVSEPQQWYTVARRERSFAIPDASPGDGAIEAPFIFRKHGYYYLFVSFDYCCRGIKSNYKIMAGRSRNITGPYLDKDNKPLDEGGGTLILSGNDRYPGVGHNAVYTFDGNDYLVFHAYDAGKNGRPVLKIMKLDWTDDFWPLADLSADE